MNRIIITIMLVIVTAFAAGCAPERGTVVARKHEAMRIYNTVHCTPVGKSTVCLPTTQVDDEDWKLKLRNGDEEGWHEVSHAEYKAHPKGSYFEAKR